MPEPVEWLPDGTPRSPRFDDIYRSATGALAQAQHVFLHGCGLPAAWSGKAQWRVLETGFGLGLNFLAAWRAWKHDPQRPGLLHFYSVEAWPVSADDIARSASAYPELEGLAGELGAQWFGLTQGVHRLQFEGGRVLLTVFIGDVRDGLRQPPFPADSIFLDGFDPQRNPAMWEPHLLKAVARHARRGAALASWTSVGEVRRGLAQCGFVVRKAEGLPPKRHSIAALFDPAWEPRTRTPVRSVYVGSCVVVGAGLSGAAAAASLALRGWQVSVLDAAAQPASGASGVPVAMLAPHASPDDNLLSRLSRAGVRMTLQQCRMRLREGEDWQWPGVLEHRVGEAHQATETAPAMQPWSRPASAQEKRSAALPPHVRALWHEQAGWVKAPALVRAWLGQEGVQWRGGVCVNRIARADDAWVLLDEGGAELARADLVVVAAALGSGGLLRDRFELQPVRGQVSWGHTAGTSLPPFPINGDGHFIPHVPFEGAGSWFCGATFGRGDTALDVRGVDHEANLARLHSLAPQAAAQVDQQFKEGSIRAWTGVRCASKDRRPLLGEIEPGLWVSTAMGSRGLTFATLCAELLAARVHGEPLPLDRRLAEAIDAVRARPVA